MRQRQEGRLHRYRAFGLVLQSELALPELGSTSAAPQSPVDVEITTTALPGLVDPIVFLGMSLARAADGLLLEIPDVARYLVRGGREICVCPDPAASAETVRIYLLGTVLGALLHQRGTLPLHA